VTSLFGALATPSALSVDPEIDNLRVRAERGHLWKLVATFGGLLFALLLACAAYLLIA